MSVRNFCQFYPWDWTSCRFIFFSSLSISFSQHLLFSQHLQMSQYLLFSRYLQLSQHLLLLLVFSFLFTLLFFLVLLLLFISLFILDSLFTSFPFSSFSPLAPARAIASVVPAASVFQCNLSLIARSRVCNCRGVGLRRQLENISKHNGTFVPDYGNSAAISIHAKPLPQPVGSRYRLYRRANLEQHSLTRLVISL